MRAAALSRTLLLCRDFVDPVDDAVLLEALGTERACIVADEANITTIPGQSVVATLASLLIQMGNSVELVMPDVDLLGQQAPLRGSAFRSALTATAPQLFPGGGATPTTKASAGALVFVIGTTRAPSWLRQHAAWRLAWSRWSGSIVPVDEPVGAYDGDFPIGALAAAPIAAAEVLKASMRFLPGAARHAEELARVVRATVHLGDDRTIVREPTLGPVDCISAGAITQAFAHALFRLPGVSARLRVIDPDVLDVTNLNRYPLGLLGRLGLAKTSFLTLHAPPGVVVEELQARADSTTLPVLGPLAARVIVGTDDIPSRWAVQAHAPGWLAVGATAHYYAVASEHGPGVACARCMHPRDDGVNATIPTIAFVSYWAGLMLVARLLRELTGSACPATEQARGLWALRLDGRHAQPSYGVVPSAACPLGCGVDRRQGTWHDAPLWRH